ncbi:MAG: FAD-dependent oxidoreductase [Acidobacteriota bacterium]
MGTCGLAAGGKKVLERIEETLQRFQISSHIVQVGCIGMCYLEPLMALRSPGKPFLYYGNLDPDKAERILIKTLTNDETAVSEAFCFRGEGSYPKICRFEELPMIRSQVRIATRNCGVIDPESISHYIANGGYSGLEKALKMAPEEVIGLIKRSGLRGRGGAGFPTGTKWELACNTLETKRYFVCNADEGDPGAFMDRSLLEGDPHSVLEGLAIGARAIGADKGYVYVRAEYPLAIKRLRKAIEQMEQYGFLGRNILGSGFSLSIDIKEGAGAFVCGEETAMLASIMGGRATPRPRPPFPAESGIDGFPTNINNVETLSNVSAILERGAEWYAGFGSGKSRGTKTFSLAGNIRRTGLIEIPLGMNLGEIIYEIGGGLHGDKKLKAVQTGGPSGGCIPSSLLNISVDYESLAEAGSIMGSGGMVVMDEDTCMVEMARYFLNFTHEESCGKCTPCRIGTGSMLSILEDITEGRATKEDLNLLTDISETIRKGALCGLGQTAPNPVVSTLRYFRSEYESHIQHRHCPAVVCASLFEAPCRHACPLGTDIPSVMALVQENRINEAHEILLRTNPFPSVCGRVCNHRCQFKCRRNTLDDTVGIRSIERFVADHSKATTHGQPDRARSEHIAVVGAGPAGLAAARQLRLKGYRVTLYESLPEPGGMLRYAIPEYRLPKHILKREVDAILNLGIDLKTSTRVGRDIQWMHLVDKFDFVCIAVGAQKSAPAGIPGEDLSGIQGAVEFLRATRLENVSCRKEKVAVIGGGDSAIDAARTARRLGASKVTILYRRQLEDMPAQKDEIDAALEEGVQIEFLATPREFEGRKGKVHGLLYQRLELGPYDQSGRRRPVPIECGDDQLEVDRVLVAIGQTTDLPFRGRSHAIQLSPQNLISITEDTWSLTSNPKVFAAGDVTTGPATVAEAIAAGFKVAEEIDRAVRTSNREPFWIPSETASLNISSKAPEETVDVPREVVRQKSATSRIRNFTEVELGYTGKQARRESGRCLRCDIKIEPETEPTSIMEIRH